MVEIPAYAPAGEGSHCFVRFEKRGLNTREATKRIATALESDPRGVGTAGLKDRHAITQQWASFADVEPELAMKLELRDITILEASKHTKKLKTGHLRGNHFFLRVREVEAPACEALLAAAHELPSRWSVPNYYGTQRFGRDGLNIGDAKAWLVDGGRGPKDRFRKRMLVSAYQSAGFNLVIGDRVGRGEIDTVLAGDVLMTQRGGSFVVDDLEVCQSRADEGEVDPTGPMFGPDMRAAEAIVGEKENQVAELLGFSAETFSRMGRNGQGTRRRARLWPDQFEIEAVEDGFTVGFTLPEGAYATVVLREFIQAYEGRAQRPAALEQG